MGIMSRLDDFFSGSPRHDPQNDEGPPKVIPGLELECPSCGVELSWRIDFEQSEKMKIAVECTNCGFTDEDEYVPGTES